MRQVRARASDAKALADLTTNSTFAPRWGRYQGREATLENVLSKARNPTVNPFYRFWCLEGQAGTNAREELIDMFSITKKAL
jgi:hypothetical protein